MKQNKLRSELTVAEIQAICKKFNIGRNCPSCPIRNAAGRCMGWSPLMFLDVKFYNEQIVFDLEERS